MSLQVWLPLTGHLNNQGLSNVTVTNNGATVDNNGKIGKCYAFSGSSQYCRIDSKVINTAQYSISFWMYATNVSSNHCIFSTRNVNSGAVNIYLLAAGIRFDTGVLWQTEFKPTANTWYHIACVQDATTQYLYVNGTLHATRTGTTTLGHVSNVCTIGCEHINGASIGVYFAGKLNDFRIYDHALSAKEVKELSKGLVLHYPLSAGFGGAENLFRDSAMGQHAQANFVANNSEDWTKYFRYYNGTAANHSFENGIDTITLQSGANIGICFCRAATDINLNSNSYYTISCEAKCEISGAHLDIGLSYRTTSDTWSWDGGSNSQNFNAVDTWQKFTLKFKPASNTKYIMYCFTINNTTGKHFSIRKCKLEKGETATPWTMNMLDAEMTDLVTTEYDVSGYNNHGNKNGILTYSSDSARYAVCSNFNGTNTYIEAEPLPASTTTISVWVKTTWDKPPGGSNIYKLVLQDKFTGLAIGFSSNNYYMVSYTGANTGGTGSNVNTANLYQANKWNHIVVIKTGSTTRTVYINGQLAPTANNSNWNCDIDKLFIGCRHQGGDYKNYFDGQISDLRIYATALTADDVKELYNTAASLANNGTLFAYSFNEV